MKFYDLTTKSVYKDLVESEYKDSREIGAVRIGKDHLFLKAGFKHYCISYPDIKRAFRRVNSVPAKMCCGKGDLQIESLVIADDEKELIQVTLPGTKAARQLMKELKERMPETNFAAPKRDENGNIVPEEG